VPKGFDPEHPRAALLKHKGLGFDFPKVPAALRTSPKLLGWLSQQVKESSNVIGVARATPALSYQTTLSSCRPSKACSAPRCEVHRRVAVRGLPQARVELILRARVGDSSC